MPPLFKNTVEELHTRNRMVGDLSGTPTYWLHCAQIYGELPGKPLFLLGRAETCAVGHLEVPAPEVVRSHYKEFGIYLPPDADTPITTYRNPVTGKVMTSRGIFVEGPAIFTMTARPDGVFGNSEIDKDTTIRLPWRWQAAGNHLWVTNDDAGVWKHGDSSSENIQAREDTQGRILQTWHADRRDLAKASAAVPSVLSYTVTTSAWPAWAGDPGERGCGFIRGMAAKLTRAQAERQPAIQRLLTAHPDLFDAGPS